MGDPDSDREIDIDTLTAPTLENIPARSDTDTITYPRLRAIGVCGALLVFAAPAGVAAVPDAAAAKHAERPAPRLSCKPGQFKVALDIGHSRAKPGAISATGVTEFEYNFVLAHAVIAALREAGFGAAFLIGESGTALPFEKRPKIAGDVGADLFVSLHHDSVQPRYLSEWTVDGRAQRYSDAFHGYSLFISRKNSHELESKQFPALLAKLSLIRALRRPCITPKKSPGRIGHCLTRGSACIALTAWPC